MKDAEAVYIGGHMTSDVYKLVPCTGMRCQVMLGHPIQHYNLPRTA